ncbi:MAG: PAS domain S-box protein, partial [Anaerolineae bacterium]|nr:PAS domain S-box protein [Anaerolineae bacterium]
MKPDKCATAFLQAGYHFWQRITQPVDVLDDLASQRRAQLLASFLVFLLLLGMAVGILPSILHYGVDYIGRVDFLVMVGTMLSIVAVYILSRTRYFVVAALLTVSVMSLGVILMALPDDINLLVYLVVPVLLSSILLSIEATMMLVLVQLVAMMLLPALFAPDVSLVDDNWVGFVMTVSGLILIIAHYRNLLEQDRRGELIGSEMRYRALFDQAYDPTFMETADQEIIDANTAACDLFGYSRDELLTMRTLDLKPPYTRAEPKRRVYSETTGVERFETVVVKRDGDLIPVEITVAPMKFGDETFFLSTVRDITERKQAEQALRHERDLLSRITDTSPIGITIV